MESRKSSRKPAPTCPSKCLQVYSWNCCLAGMPRKFEETPVYAVLDSAPHESCRGNVADHEEFGIHAKEPGNHARDTGNGSVHEGYRPIRSDRQPRQEADRDPIGSDLFT